MLSVIVQTMFTEGWNLGFPIGIMSEENEKGIDFACVGYLVGADHASIRIFSKDQTRQWTVGLPTTGKREIIPHEPRRWTINVGEKRIYIAQDLSFCQKAMFLCKMHELSSGSIQSGFIN